MAEISAKPSSFYGLYRECIASRIHAPTSRRHGVPYPLPPTYPLGVTDTPLRHWHGGAPGLRAGDVLLPPPIETGLIFTRLTMSLEEGQTEIGQRPDRVYVSTDRELAWAYASAWTLDGRCRGRIAIPSRGESPRARRGLCCLYPARPIKRDRARIIEAEEVSIPLDVARCRSVHKSVSDRSRTSCSCKGGRLSPRAGCPDLASKTSLSRTSRPAAERPPHEGCVAIIAVGVAAELNVSTLFTSARSHDGQLNTAGAGKWTAGQRESGLPPDRRR